MRFNTVIKDRRYNYLHCLCNFPHRVFSNDFIYYILRDYDLDWEPYAFVDTGYIKGIEIIKPGLRIYTSHPLSMFTETVKHAVKTIMSHDTLNFGEIYDKLVPPGAENKLERFSNHVNKGIYTLLSRVMTYSEILIVFTYIGRLTAAFYKRGTRDCAHVAPHLISDALMKATEAYTFAQCFYDLHNDAKFLYDWFKENDKDLIDKTFYDEFFNLDESIGETHEANNTKET